LAKVFGKDLIEKMKGRSYWLADYKENIIDGVRYCIWCGNDLIGRKRKYCNEDCDLSFWQIYKGEFVWSEIRNKIFNRDDFTCQKCKTKYDPNVLGDDAWSKLECHHIIARVEGGTHKDENLVTLCKECHKKETRKLTQRIFTTRKFLINRHHSRLLLDFLK